MIIDLRTRVWSSLEQLGAELAGTMRQRFADRWERIDGSPPAHERAMTCTGGACIMGFRSELLGAAVPNELVAEFVARDPARRVGIAGIDPLSSDARDELRKAMDLGLVGVAVSPAAQGFHPTHSTAMRLYEECEDKGLPVFVVADLPATPSCVLEFGRPTIFDEVARTFPELRIVIGELGVPFLQETLAMIAKHPNVYSDVSGVVSRPWELYNALLLASQANVMDKILFGSGFPFETPTHAIETLYSINGYSHGTQLPSIPRPQIRGIIERDALSMLNVEHEFGHASQDTRQGSDITGDASFMTPGNPYHDDSGTVDDLD